uniref:NADH-ubiquinone oxidoreductase chain 5 n=1 Tax=Lepidurus apus lubbocki TaxID=217954 RepID=A0A5B7XU44_9CRUS|nr:NADH dehydrogenase subunit 5 [Lepidurus apus lubbocki]QCZ36056.1 NADH dehydrogenase subunit 5 [Lepidurus apus lubbocki]
MNIVMFYHIISVSFYFLSLGVFILGLNTMMTQVSMFFEFNFFCINSVTLSGTFLVDWISCFFISIVLFISATVVLYSWSYMYHDLWSNRFILIVAMFVFTMILLISSPNLISILLGWDGLGLVSYALVIYYQNSKSSAAGMLTALSNRIGDVCFLLSISWWMMLGDYSFLPYFQWDKLFDLNSLMILSFVIILAGMTKSAQIPFSSWLPAAMAAPTPVSALVHSSTLVTAGVYLLIRFYPLLDGTLMLDVLLCLSASTMFMAGMAAIYEYDLKKVIALSTLSQLGIMMFSVSMGFPVLAFFHLIMHALFKALLFLCAGVFIHQMNGWQDIRKMGGVSLSFPLTSSYFNMANLALCGMPFLAGFYSKDAIIELALMSYMNSFVLILLIISTILTGVYSFRLAYFSMLMPPGFMGMSKFLDEDTSMINPMFFLGVCGIVGGTVFSWLIFPYPILTILPVYIKMTALICGCVGIFLSMLFTSVSMVNNFLFCYMTKNFIVMMWFLPYLSGHLISICSLPLGKMVSSYLDQGWLEKTGAQGFYEKLLKMFNIIIILQKSSMKSYFFLFICSLFLGLVLMWF